MKRTMQKNRLRAMLVAGATLLAAASLIVSQTLVHDLEQQEVAHMEVWAEAMKSLGMADETTDLALVARVIESNRFIPVIVLDADSSVLLSRNVKIEKRPAEADTLRALTDEALRMMRQGRVIPISLDTVPSADDTATRLYVCYDDSLMLRRLGVYPFVQLALVALFIAVAVYALLSSKRAEQNRVWVGLSKETAHQLGTPISSLLAWCAVLRENYPDDPLLPELEGDVQRLQRIAERFSKIGSTPDLTEEELCSVIARSEEYLARRAPRGISLTHQFPIEGVRIPLSAPLFEWVVENLCKNAIDAITSGTGNIHIAVTPREKDVRVTVTDTGKGIAPNLFHTVFNPGFSTKKRGWGLGLSLAKRIVEDYHGGRIFVLNSTPGRGTTFAIDLKRA